MESTIVQPIITQPDGTDFSKMGDLQRLLTGNPGERNPLEYAAIFEIASQAVDISPWMEYACRIEVINGKRRAKGADFKTLVAELETLATEAAADVPDGVHKYALLGSIKYNTALILRNLREYSRAAEAQRQASGWYGVAGDSEKQAVYAFAAQVEEVTAAFVKGEPTEIEKDISALIAMRDFVANTFHPYPQWMQMNASLHIGWAVMMANILDIGPSWTQFPADFKAGVASPLVAWAKVFRVWLLYSTGMLTEAAGMMPVEVQSSSASNTDLSVKLIAALAGKCSMNMDITLTEIAEHTGPDGGIPMAVAKELLKR